VPRTSAEAGSPEKLLRFGAFELDMTAAQLLKNGRVVRLQPQPFKLLCLLVTMRGQLVTRDQIRAALWSDDTFVDVEQGVNFAIKQVRDALGEDADHPLHIQTLPRRGYRFVAPVDPAPAVDSEESPESSRSELSLILQKALWTNIADLRMAEERRVRRRHTLKIAFAAIGVLAGLAGLVLLLARYVVLR